MSEVECDSHSGTNHTESLVPAFEGATKSNLNSSSS